MLLPVEKQKDLANRILNQVADAACKNLKNNKIAYEYAKSRGLTDKIISDFKIGLIPFEIKDNEWDTWIFKQAKIACPEAQEGDLLELIYSIGLISNFENKEGQLRVKSVFGNRLAIPYYDKDDKAIGFTTRKIDALVEENSTFESPKYLNSSESVVFKKSEKFFNYSQAKKLLVSQNSPLILAEGELDTIAYTKANVPAVACSGVSLSDYQINLLKTLPTKNIIMAYDNDLAGKEAMFNNYPALLEAGFNVSFVNYQDLEQKDADEIVNNPQFGPNEIINLYTHPQSEVSFLFDYFIYKATHIVSHDKKTNKEIQTEIPKENLTDKDIFDICFNVFDSLYKNHKYKVSLASKQELENYIASIFPSQISVEQSHEIVKKFIELSIQKPARRYFRVKNDQKKKIVPQWNEFANSKTIHFVLELLGATKGKGRNFYRSLWNPDSNASFSVKNTGNVWSDFSAGKSGGIYQLIGYLDLSDPDKPIITENPKQTSPTQAYNWLIQKTNSTLPLATEVDTVDSFSFSSAEKTKITNIEKYFESKGEFNGKIVSNLDHTSSPSDIEQFQSVIGVFTPDTQEQIENHNASFFVKTKTASCPYNTDGIAHCKIDPTTRTLVCVEDSPTAVYLASETNPRTADLIFSVPDWDTLLTPAASSQLKAPSFLVPQSYEPKILSDILKNNLNSINIINPTKEFVQSAFEQLSSSKKQIFINGQDLYLYMTQNYLLPFGQILDAVIKDNPNSLFVSTILDTMDKLHRNKSFSFKTLYSKKLKSSSKSSNKR